MPGIREEIVVFVLAVISGGIVRLAYRCISCLRQIIKHRQVLIEIEDLFFWVGAAIYLFVQIYHTSDGSIRWYFILGVAFGAILMTFILNKIEKIFQKIYTHKQKDFHKGLD